MLNASPYDLFICSDEKFSIYSIFINVITFFLSLIFAVSILLVKPCIEINLEVTELTHTQSEWKLPFASSILFFLFILHHPNLFIFVFINCIQYESIRSDFKGISIVSLLLISLNERSIPLCHIFIFNTRF